VLQIDLHGCGDSSGDFADATWADWVGDVLLAARWLQAQHEGAPLCLWGLRAGALLAMAAAQQLGGACQLLLWQPVLSGQQHLKQFLRLKAAAEMAQGDAKGLLARMRSDLSEGRAVEVAGYRLPPALALGLEQARLDLPPNATHVAWLEVSTRADAVLMPASAACVEAWRSQGYGVAAQAVGGPAFWQTQEIEDATMLVAVTLEAIRAWQPVAA
jgi:exosortase A-associated hydrolase 2